jgi:ferrous iron transport protein B
LAYCASFLVYQFGHVIFEGGHLTLGVFAAIVIAGLLVFALVKKPFRGSAPLIQVVGGEK